MSFLLKVLAASTAQVDTKTSHKLVVEVMQFALATTATQNCVIKLAALRLLRNCIEQLRFTVEVVGDQDEDLTPDE